MTLVGSVLPPSIPPRIPICPKRETSEFRGQIITKRLSDAIGGAATSTECNVSTEEAVYGEEVALGNGQPDRAKASGRKGKFSLATFADSHLKLLKFRPARKLLAKFTWTSQHCEF